MAIKHEFTFDGVKANKTTLRLFEKGLVSKEECFSGVLDGTFFAAEETWIECISVVPASLRKPFVQFARSYLADVDFMPPVGVVLPPPSSREESEAMKQAIKLERRPRYIRLLQLIEQAWPLT